MRNSSTPEPAPKRRARGAGMNAKKPNGKKALAAAMKRARQTAKDLPKLIQVVKSDWDTVLMADEIMRLREYERIYDDQ